MQQQLQQYEVLGQAKRQSRAIAAVVIIIGITTPLVLQPEAKSANNLNKD